MPIRGASQGCPPTREALQPSSPGTTSNGIPTMARPVLPHRHDQTQTGRRLSRTTRFPRARRGSSADESSPAARCPGARAYPHRSTGPRSSGEARLRPRARRPAGSASSSRRTAEQSRAPDHRGPRRRVTRIRAPLPFPFPFPSYSLFKVSTVEDAGAPSGRCVLSTLAGWRQQPTASTSRSRGSTASIPRAGRTARARGHRWKSRS